LSAWIASSIHLGFLLALARGESQRLDSLGVVLRLGSYLRLCSTPQYYGGRRQVVTALSVPSSPPRSGVFIAVGLPKVCWAPSHPFLSPSLRPPKQIKLVASQVILVIRILSRDKPSTLVPLPPAGPVESLQTTSRSLSFLGFDIPGLLTW